ncbi:hypothetical protein [Mesorhizobium sp.]|uniref:hypothetical protein n=1 Tax=Mesorhizobium sp. TaxID=1871066 RepID=UPI000FE4C2A2|nr:hypothetical protein [Mesorhizobium sp.]RWD33481.1 MAG: hypothetical protein EOS33_11780 [Mesorhizobium sp.]
MSDHITAIDMARSVGVDPKAYRQALREADFPWHHQNERWTVEIDSPEHEAMRTVLNLLKRDQAT